MQDVISVDLMLFVEGKAYQQSIMETKYNLLNPADLIRAYSPIMHYCLEYNDVYFTRYMFEHVDPNKVKDIDNTDLPLVAFNNRLELFRLYMENRDVDLKTAFTESLVRFEDNYHLIPALSGRYGMDKKDYQIFWVILYIDSDFLARYLVQKGLIPKIDLFH